MAGNVLHTMPLKCERLLSSQRYRMMAWDERGVYLQLLAEAWLEQCYLPSCSNALAKLIGCNDDATWQRMMRNVVCAMFKPTCDGKKYYNDVQMQIYEEVQAKHSKRVRAGQKGAKQRLSNATAMLKQRVSNQNQNQNQSQSKKESTKESKPAAPRFSPPTLDDVRAYCQERGNDVDPERWHAFYAAKNWMIGKNKMRDWRAAVRTWEKPKAAATKNYALWTDDDIRATGKDLK